MKVISYQLHGSANRKVFSERWEVGCQERSIKKGIPMSIILHCFGIDRQVSLFSGNGPVI